jgi:hypothetical protein
MVEKVVDISDHITDNNIDDAAAILEDCRRKGGEAMVAALEAVVIGNLLKRHHQGPVGGILKLIYCAESLLGPLGLTINAPNEGTCLPILIELPEGVEQLFIGGQKFVKTAA